MKQTYVTALAALLVCGALSAAAVQDQTIQPATPTLNSEDGSSDPAHSINEEDQRVRNVVQYQLDMAGMADRVANGGSLTVKATHGEYVTMLLTEHELFVEGEKKIVDLDANGNVVSETPILARSFQGTLASDPSSRVSMVIAPEGLYGVIESRGRAWSFQPSLDQEPAPPGTITQEVVSYDAPNPVEAPVNLLDATLLPTAFAPEAQVETSFSTRGGSTGNTQQGTPTRSNSGGSGGSSSSDPEEYFLKTYVDSTYASNYGGWSNRVYAAYNAGASMWSDTSIKIYLFSFVNAGVNFGRAACGAGWDGGHTVFSHWLVNNGKTFQGPNAYILFEAATDMGAGVAGCAQPAHLDCNYNCGYGHDLWATAAISAKDWYNGACCTYDSYDPDEPHDLGIALHHEMTHLAGEPGHPGDGSSCNYNIMKNGVPFWCSYFWRTSLTKSYVRTYAYFYT